MEEEETYFHNIYVHMFVCMYVNGGMWWDTHSYLCIHIITYIHTNIIMYIYIMKILIGWSGCSHMALASSDCVGYMATAGPPAIATTGG